MAKFESINSIKIEDIIEYCKENNQIEWLKKTAHEKETRKKTKKVTTTNENGEAVEKEVVEEVETEISFITLRSRFVEAFMPEIKKGSKSKKATFRDLIDSL